MDFILPPLFYLPALVWVVASIIVSYKKLFVPTWLFLILYAVFSISNIWLNGWFTGGVSVVLAFILGLVFAYTGITKRSTTIFLTILFAALPFPAWIFTIFPGILFAGLVAAIQIRKATEKGYLTMLTGETLFGMGVGGGLPFVNSPKPDFSRIPVPDPNVTEGNMGKTNKIRIRLPVFFGLTVVANILVAFIA
jgi:hypothetical protein